MSALPPKADMDRRDGECPLSADCVAKVSAEKLWNRNLKQSNRSARFSESTLRLAPNLESILRARMRKIVLQHNLPGADMRSAAKPHCYSITSSAATSSLSGTVSPSILAVW